MNAHAFIPHLIPSTVFRLKKHNRLTISPVCVWPLSSEFHRFEQPKSSNFYKCCRPILVVLFYSMFILYFTLFVVMRETNCCERSDWIECVYTLNRRYFSLFFSLSRSNFIYSGYYGLRVLVFCTLLFTSQSLRCL